MGSELRTRWTDEHGADGLRDKFHVYAAKSRLTDWPNELARRSCYRAAERLGATGEFVFVLRPESDEAAWDALDQYAIDVEHRAPQLADDIRKQLNRIIKDQIDA